VASADVFAGGCAVWAIAIPALAEANAAIATDTPNPSDRWRAKDISDDGNMMHLRMETESMGAASGCARRTPDCSRHQRLFAPVRELGYK
jgi:hypothetical protein